ncbi:MAG: S8 family peptidase [Oligoflexus sp.]
MKVNGKLFALILPVTVLGVYLAVRTSDIESVNSSTHYAPLKGKSVTQFSLPESQRAISPAQAARPENLAENDSYEASEADSYQAQTEQNAKGVKTVDRLRQTRVSQLSQVVANEGPLAAMKARHVERLLSKPILESQTWKDPKNENLIKASLVEDKDSQYRHFIVKQVHRPGETEPLNSYVQIANHLLVRFSKDPSSRELENFAKKHNISLNKKLLLPRSYLFEFSEVSIERLRELEEAIAREPQVETFDANSLTYPTKVPNDPLFRTLWGLQNNGVDPQDRVAFKEGIDLTASQAWEDMTDCSSTIVAVMDTGIDPNHPDLQENVLADQGRNFTTNNAADFIDRQGHGTHVAGTVGAVGNNAVGITGVCWKASIIPVKVLSDEGFGTLDMMVNGLMYVAQTEAKVLNLSLGGAPPTNAEQQAIAANTSQGKILVIAAGNENNDNDVNPSYPASYPDPLIISVAALHGNGDLAGFSNYGATSVDIAAPGQEIVSTYPVALSNNNAANAYQILSGTSMASPHVAGAVALFWSYAPDLTAQEIRQEILDTADPGTFNGKQVAGSRMINVSKMMDAVKAQAQFTNLESGSTVVLQNSRNYEFSLATVEKYAGIASIEIMHGDEVIGIASGAVDKLSVELPLGYSQLELVAKVTDAQGRVYFSEPVELGVDIDKILKFTELSLENNKGNVPCELSKTAPDNSQVSLYQTSVDTERTCQKLCEIIGPLAFSSAGEITCNSGSATLYTKSGDQTASVEGE